MKVEIPTSIKNNEASFNFIAQIAEETKDLVADSLELDFLNCSFFEANMVAPLFAVIIKLWENLNSVYFINMSKKIENILRKNLFLTMFSRMPLWDRNLTTIPFKKFKLNANEQFFEYIESNLKNKGIPSMSDALTKHFLRSLLEIFQNAAMHSQSAHGIFTCGQFFPKKKRLDFTIADSGIGFLENVYKHTGDKEFNSSKAILWAVQEGNTTQKNHPGGLGLKLLKEFIKINKGKLQIISRFGYYCFNSSEEECFEMEHDFPGTCVNLEINTADTKSYYLKSELSSKDIF